MIPETPELSAERCRWLPDPRVRRRLQRLKDEHERHVIRQAIDSLHPELLRRRNYETERGISN